ncbi:unnamed protein product [Durusdinium trenchii]|uniref:R-spondin Fu-CRD domain-containing protein n=1 Tax=Durusdinium trenchii TaxID=1381693 RepID=A0ABP0NU26_9DINO
MSCQENCPVGFFGVGTAETGRTCQPCSANCSACQSQAFCTKCTNGTFLTADFSCEAQCPEGFYSRSPADGSLDGRACEKCLGDCLTCETRFYCTKCKNAAYLTHRKERLLCRNLGNPEQSVCLSWFRYHPFSAFASQKLEFSEYLFQ